MKQKDFDDFMKSIRQMGRIMKGEKLAGTKVIYEHHGWKFHEVSPKLKKEINQLAKVVETGKVKAIRWKGSFGKTFGEKS